MFVAATAPAKKLGNELTAKLLASSGFRWAATKERITQKHLQGGLKRLARVGELASAIERLIEELLRDRINHHISGSGVEGDDVFKFGSRRDCGEIRDASNVLHDTTETAMAK